MNKNLSKYIFLKNLKNDYEGNAIFGLENYLMISRNSRNNSNFFFLF